MYPPKYILEPQDYTMPSLKLHICVLKTASMSSILHSRIKAWQGVTAIFVPHYVILMLFITLSIYGLVAIDKCAGEGLRPQNYMMYF